ncbi:MAG: DUF885 domain-containing protein [Deltaproteobacteria bacterium]|nr:DUF885 domain-containing protein [Deltaproteobacteria bacterium]
MPDHPFATLDRSHVQALLEAMPEMNAFMSNEEASVFSAATPDLLSFFRGWSEKRSSLSLEEVPLLERALEETQTKALDLWVAFLEVLKKYDLQSRDPDVLTDRLLFIDAQTTDPTHDRERRLATSASLLSSLGPALAAFQKNLDPEKLDPALLRRALQMMPLYDDILSALCEDADEHHEVNQKSPAAKDLVAAARDADISLQKHAAFLEELSEQIVAASAFGSPDKAVTRRDARHNAIGEEAYAELLKARSLPDLAALGMSLRCGIHDLRIEEIRLRRRCFAGKTVAEIKQTPLSENPRNMDEALAWAEELVDLSHTFALESQLFPMSSNEQILVGTGFPNQGLVQSIALLRLPRKDAQTQVSRLLLTPGTKQSSEPELAHLHLATLEALATRALSPGAHLFAMWANSAEGVLQNGNLGGLSVLQKLYGQESQLGWDLHIEELMRELQFRDSPAIRLVVLHHTLAAAVHARVDLQLHTEGISTSNAMHQLMTTGRLSFQEARNRVWSSLRAPTGGLSAFVGRNIIHDLRRRARVIWRHEFSERRMNEFLLFHGRLPLSLLKPLIEAPTPFAGDEHTAKYDLNELPNTAL